MNQPLGAQISCVRIQNFSRFCFTGFVAGTDVPTRTDGLGVERGQAVSTLEKILQFSL